MSSLGALIIVLAILMTIIGGETGIRSFFSVLINSLLLVLVAMLISWGLSIPIITSIFVPLKLATIIFLGTHDYTVAKNSFYASLIVLSLVSVLILGIQYLAQAAGLGPEAGKSSWVTPRCRGSATGRSPLPWPFSPPLGRWRKPQCR